LLSLLILVAAGYLLWPYLKALESTQDRVGGAGGRIGHVNVVLSWQGYDDVDLEVICPDGQAINAHTKTGCNGTLDVDQNWTANPGSENPDLVQYPVENIVWDRNAPRGLYRVRVHRYSDRPPLSRSTPFKVELLIDRQVVKSVTGNADDVMREVFTFELPYQAGTAQPDPGRKR